MLHDVKEGGFTEKMGKNEEKMWRLSCPNAQAESRKAYMLVRGGAEESSEKPITITGVGTGHTKLWFPSPHVKRARTWSMVDMA